MPRAAFKVLVDWDKDGDFTDANSDITGDVRTTGKGLEISHGKRFPQHKAEARTCQFVLNNDDHKYSPPLTTSVLYPYVIPAPNLWVLMGYPMDDFDASNGTTLASRKPTYDDLFDAWGGDASSFDIQSNKLRSTSAGDYQAVLDFGDTDCFSAADFTYGTASSGLIVRYSDTNNYILIYPNGADIITAKVDSGTLSTLKTASLKDKDGVSFAWSAGETKKLACETHGDEIRVFVNDVYQHTISNSFNNTATKHGVGGKNTHANDRWEDYGGWRSIFYGRIDSIKPRPETDRQYVYIRALDDMERMSQHQVYREAPTGSSSTNADDILNRILDAVDGSAQNRILDVGSNLSQDEAHEKSMGRDGLTEVQQLSDDDVGFFFIDGAGNYRYEDAAHRQASPHTGSIKQWKSVRGDPPSESDIEISGDNFEWDDGVENVENEIYYWFHRISRTTAVEVWRLEVLDKPLIANGGTLDMLAIGEEAQISNPIIPIHTTDWTLNTAEGGTGTALQDKLDDESGGTVSASGSSAYTLDCTTPVFTSPIRDGKHQVEITDNGGQIASAWIGTSDVDGDNTKVQLYTSSALSTLGYGYSHASYSESDTPLAFDIFDSTAELVTGFDGNFRRISITNNSGSDGYLTFCRLRADKGKKSYLTGARAESSTSQTDVGRRRIEHQALHVDRFGDIDSDGIPTDAGSALDRATERLHQRSLRKEVITCHMSNTTRACLMQILHRSVSDRIRLTYESMGIDATYHIESQTINITEGGLKVDCDWALQQAVGEGWGFFNWGPATGETQWA